MNKRMMKGCVAGAMLLGAASVEAALIVEDSFATGGSDYALAPLYDQSPAVPGMNGGWIYGDNRGGLEVDAAGLEYADANYLNGGGGSVVASGANYARAGRLLDTAYTDASVGTVYMSFLMRMPTVDSSQYRALELHDGGFDDGANRMFQLGSHKSDMTPGEFGFRLENSGDFKGQLGTLNTNVNLFVAKFEFSDVADSDSVTVWQNPTLGGAGDPVGGVTLTGANMSFDRVSFARYNANAGLAWDEVRLGETFNDVIPEPGTLGLLAAFGGGLLIIRRTFKM